MQLLVANAVPEPESVRVTQKYQANKLAVNSQVSSQQAGSKLTSIKPTSWLKITARLDRHLVLSSLYPII
jgi:hypothetical protein